MAVSKVILNGVTIMDTTGVTVVEEHLDHGYTALKNDGTLITGTMGGDSPSGPDNLVGSAIVGIAHAG